MKRNLIISGEFTVSELKNEAQCATAKPKTARQRIDAMVTRAQVVLRRPQLTRGGLKTSSLVTSFSYTQATSFLSVPTNTYTILNGVN